ncbi:hypothetical protein [Piscirickettsia litoralis]|nr:hypothetical protein [Piscirickettsia litoralis]
MMKHEIFQPKASNSYRDRVDFIYKTSKKFFESTIHIRQLLNSMQCKGFKYTKSFHQSDKIELIACPYSDTIDTISSGMQLGLWRENPFFLAHRIGVDVYTQDIGKHYSDSSLVDSHISKCFTTREMLISEHRSYAYTGRCFFDIRKKVYRK